MEHTRLRRAGEAAAALAERRRAGAAAAAAARANLAAYWNRHNAGAPNFPKSPATEDYLTRVAQNRAENLTHQRLKEKTLEERRNKLSLMLFYEDLEIQEELKNQAMQAKYIKNSGLNLLPTRTLHDINFGIKAREEEQRKQEADLRLYHQWRNNNPVVQKYEESQRNCALKSAWMEQIIEKETIKQKEKEEMQKLLKEREERIKEQIEYERENEIVKEQKMKEVEEELCRQISELKSSEEAATNLINQCESEKNLLRIIKEATAVRQVESLKRNAAHKTVLNNMSFHARKIRERAKEAELDVTADLKELDNVIAAIENDAHRDDINKKMWHQALADTRDSFCRQRELEKNRQLRLNDIMDSEAKVLLEKQDKIWREEHLARQALLGEVLAVLEKQLDCKILQCRENHKKNIAERENLLNDIDKRARQLEEWEMEKTKRQQGLNKISILEGQIKQLEREESRLNAIDGVENELKTAIQEEERLRSEIIKLQRQGCGFQRKRVDW